MKPLLSVKRCKSEMYPSSSSQKQSGAGLPVAIFIITVLALLVLGMSQLQESSGQAVSLQIQSQRAFFAAESGAQVAVAAVLPDDSGDSVSCAAAPTSSPINFSASGLSSCQARITCLETSGVLTIESAGSCGTGIDQASRTVGVRVQ